MTKPLTPKRDERSKAKILTIKRLKMTQREMKQNYFCGGCDKQIPIVIGINQLHICQCGTLNNIGDAE